MAASPPPGARLSWARIGWLAIRPKTLLLSVSPVAVATALAARAHAASLGIALLSVCGAFGLQVGTNLFNDWADAATGADGDDRLGPLRVTATGHLSARRVVTLAVLAFALATACGLGLIALTESNALSWSSRWLVVAVGLSGIVCGYAYTSGPCPLAYVGLGEAFAFAYFGPIAVVTAFVLQADAFEPAAAWLGTALGAFAAAVLAINNLRDREGDARAGKKTPAVRFGAAAVRRLIVACLAAPYAIALAFALWGPARWSGAGLAVFGAPLAWRVARRVHTHDGRALNAELAGAARAQLVYAALVCLGLATVSR